MSLICVFFVYEPVGHIILAELQEQGAVTAFRLGWPPRRRYMQVVATCQP